MDGILCTLNFTIYAEVICVQPDLTVHALSKIIDINQKEKWAQNGTPEMTSTCDDGALSMMVHCFLNER